MSLRLLALVACLGLPAPAATTLTLQNGTGSALQVTRYWSPWLPEPDDGPMTVPFFRRTLKAGAVATWNLPGPGKELEATIIIHRLPADGVVDFEQMTIQAVPAGEDPAPEPATPPLRSSL